MAEKNTVPNLEANHQTETQYLPRDNGWRDLDNLPNENTKSTSHH